MPLEWYLAIRFLREGRVQTALIVAGVTVGVTVLVFLTALITGLQASLIEQTLGTQAHVVVRPPEEEVRELYATAAPRGTVVASRLERPAQRVRSIDQWQRIERDLETMPEVTAVSSMVSGAAFAVRGNASRSVALLGVDPERFDRIVRIEDNLVEGTFRLEADGAVIGTELADDLGAGVGDRIRVTTAEGRAQLLVVRGIFAIGNRDLDSRWVFVSQRSAQTLLDLVGGASNIDLTVDEIFEADAVANDVEERTGLVAESWMERNRPLLVGLRSQSASSMLIRVFVIIAVAMGIASVLVVSVVQKSRQIGILRAMGVSRRSILLVFLLQGGLVGLAGAAAGSALGAVLARSFASLNTGPGGTPTFPVALEPSLFASATLIAIATGLLAAVLPARRAARLDPAEAMRHE